MKKLTLAVMASFISFFSFSQQQMDFERLSGLPYTANSFDDKKEEITGSKYLEDDFQIGVISDDKGNSSNALIRYNALEEIVEIKLQNTKSSEIRVLPKIRNITYSLNDYKFIYDSFTTNSGEKLEGYLIEYYNGNSYGLYGKPTPVIIAAQAAKTGYQDIKPAQLNIEINYYLKLKNGNLYKVDLKNNDFKKLLPQSATLNKFMAENTLRTPQDFGLLLKWLENQPSI